MWSLLDEIKKLELEANYDCQRFNAGRSPPHQKRKYFQLDSTVLSLVHRYDEYAKGNNEMSYLAAIGACFVGNLMTTTQGHSLADEMDAQEENEDVMKENKEREENEMDNNFEGEPEMDHNEKKEENEMNYDQEKKENEVNSNSNDDDEEEKKGKDDKWIKEMHLTNAHHDILTATGWLDDILIDAGKELLRKEHKGGLNSTLLVSSNKVQLGQEKNVIQIHHDATRQHWFVSQRVNEKVFLHDSLRPKMLSHDCIKQLKNYHGLKPGSQVFLRNVQQQSNSDDCGIFAIAFATALANKNDITRLSFHESS